MNQKSVPVAKAIADRIERLILDGGLAPEEKIPSERQLALRMGVSRSIVREALHELHGRGVIETQHGRGSFVAHIVPEPGMETPLMRLFTGHTRTLYDLLEVREQLEGQAARLAAQRATSRDRHRITKAYDAMQAADPLTNAGLDHAFHLAIVEASHNPVLVHVLDSLKSLMLMTVQASVTNLSPREPFKKQIDQHHRKIYQAIMKGQPQAAQRAATAHVRHVSESMREIEENEHPIIRSGPVSRHSHQNG
ncbi:transcriptional regulator, GntR family [Marinobacter daqiaonensis]|uniref:Transcriptional regulator, GntR family n=1 Tax=Marinobacter daqiaonensis TaxID=650891 RepID=A0A1I6HTT8_9GAMM|nr:FCD domain-containing protein [Marinobacter daqiaonensis]SFR57866.1 transcriptional regulator, GntR family [Marinobacter daqiaonensis]